MRPTPEDEWDLEPSAISTIALSATATYLIGHHTGPLAPAIAATHGYTIAFGVSARLLGLGFVLAIVLLPSRRRLAELKDAGAVTPAAPGPPPALAPPAAAAAPAQRVPRRFPSPCAAARRSSLRLPNRQAFRPGSGQAHDLHLD
jgi:hypothetical protein